MMQRKILAVIGLAATLLGFVLLYRIFSKQDLNAIAVSMASTPQSDIALACLCTALSFICIATIELLAVGYIRKPVPALRVAATAVAAIGIGHAVGLAALSSGAIRYRMYQRAGLRLVSTGKVVVFSGLTAMCGFSGAGGVSLLWHAESFGEALNVSGHAVRVVGGAALVMLVTYIVLCAFSPKRIFRISRGFRIRIPSARFAIAQIIIANTNVLCIGGALYACLHSFSGVGYPTATALYVGSDMMALISHVPGGWGVLEYIVTSVLDNGRVLAGIVLFRAIYYILPLLVGLCVFCIDEIAARRMQQLESRSMANALGG